MNTIKKIAVLIFFIVATRGQAQEVSISFKIKDYPDTIAYVGYYFGNQKYLLDTLEVNKESFSLEKKSVKPGLYFVYSPNYFLEFIMHGGTYELSTTKAGGYRDMKVKGSLENEQFRDFQLTLGGLQKEQRELLEKLKSGKEDSLLAVKRLGEIDRDILDFKSKLKAQDSESFLVAFIKLLDPIVIPDMDSIADAETRNLLSYTYFKAHYFDGVDLSDERLLRTPVIHDKVISFFDRAVLQQPDSINAALDWFFVEIGDSQELFRYWLVTLFKKYSDSKIMGMDAVTIHLMEHYYLTDRADWVTEDFRKKLEREVAFVKPNLIGNKAPLLNVLDVNMKPFLLGQVKAPYTLLFLYDPDCGHCKKAVKELVKQQPEFDKHQVKIVAICTTSEVEKWRTFILENNPAWIHGIDPQGKSNFRVSYDVRSTPKIYLLSEDKYILTKQLGIDQVVDYLNHRRTNLTVQEEE